MDLDQPGVLTVGLLVPKEGRQTLPQNTLLVIPPSCSKPPFFVITSGQCPCNTWSTRHTLAANLISGHLVHAGNHRHGTTGHRQGQCSAQ